MLASGCFIAILAGAFLNSGQANKVDRRLWTISRCELMVCGQGWSGDQSRVSLVLLLEYATATHTLYCLFPVYSHAPVYTRWMRLEMLFAWGE